MPELQVTLETITPLFLAGADGTTPELRPASFRGALRFWLRALLGGALGDDLKAIKATEVAVFGSTDAASPIIVRILTHADRLTYAGYRPLLHNPQRTFKFEGWDTDQSFTVRILTRPGVPAISDAAMASLLLLISLGGLGRRSRRGFGSLQIQSSKVSDGQMLSKEVERLFLPRLPDSKALAAYLERLVKWAQTTVNHNTSPKAWPNLPSFSVLTADHARVLVCRQPFDSWESAMHAFWSKLRAQPYRDDSVFGFVARKERRASPLLVKIWRVSEHYHLVLTVFQTKLFPGRRGNWSLMAQFVNDCRDDWNGTYVLGGEEAW